MEVIRRHPKFVAEIQGLDLKKDLSAGEQTQLRQLVLDHKVLLFRGQELSPTEYIRFCAQVGRIWTTQSEMALEKKFQFEEYPELVRVSSHFGVLGPMELLYHADGSHHPTQPYPLRALYGEKVPANRGGETTWADMEVAYEALTPSQQEEWRGVRALHVPRYATGWENEAVYHPLIRVHPVSKRKSLSVDQYFTRSLEGWEDVEASKVEIDRLLHWAVNLQNTYTHVWQPFDLVIFDNNNTVHRRTRIDPEEERLLLRITMDFL